MTRDIQIKFNGDWVNITPRLLSVDGKVIHLLHSKLYFPLSANQSTIAIPIKHLSNDMVTVGLQQELFPERIRFAITQTLNKINV